MTIGLSLLGKAVSQRSSVHSLIVSMTAFTLNLMPIVQLTDEQFYRLCRVNPELKFERNASSGGLVILAPTGGETGSYNSEINADKV